MAKIIVNWKMPFIHRNTGVEAWVDQHFETVLYNLELNKLEPEEVLAKPPQIKEQEQKEIEMARPFYKDKKLQDPRGNTLCKIIRMDGKKFVDSEAAACYSPVFGTYAYTNHDRFFPHLHYMKGFKGCHRYREAWVNITHSEGHRFFEIHEMCRKALRYDNKQYHDMLVNHGLYLSKKTYSKFSAGFIRSFIVPFRGLSEFTAREAMAVELKKLPKEATDKQVVALSWALRNFSNSRNYSGHTNIESRHSWDVHWTGWKHGHTKKWPKESYLEYHSGNGVHADWGKIAKKAEPLFQEGVINFKSFNKDQKGVWAELWEDKKNQEKFTIIDFAMEIGKGD